MARSTIMTMNIHDIPPEIMEEIFELYCNSCTLLPRWLDPLIISAVCRRWRLIALGCSRLWRRVDVAYPRPAKEFLTRSAPGTIDIVTDTHPNIRIRGSDLLPHVDRIRSFEVTWILFGELTLLFHGLTEFKSLTRLSLKKAYSGGKNGILHLPPLTHLRKLELQGTVIRWDSLPRSLKSLTLHELENYYITPTLPQLWAVLQSLPQLEQLSLDLRSYSYLPQHIEMSAASALPHLRELFIRAGGYLMHEILSHISIPSMTHIDTVLLSGVRELQSIHPLTQNPNHSLNPALTTLQLTKNIARLFPHSAKPWSDLTNAIYPDRMSINVPFQFRSAVEDFGFDLLHSFFFDNAHFTTLEIEANMLQHMSIDRLADAFRHFTNVTTLRVDRNNIYALCRSLSPGPIECVLPRLEILSLRPSWVINHNGMTRLLELVHARREAGFPLEGIEMKPNLKRGLKGGLEEFRKVLSRVVEFP
ncbi:hypothetical protein H0H81_002683 [Sphagnurus paluster]|uniref:F-box domain-containing protein n=1 Tax=Sphagnurus paluster TaxID=117069 RepID=A0A9P7FSS2_9AGAR|nr:hypothetical protein H0H81_002683 [Sphagnurus paluster]